MIFHLPILLFIYFHRSKSVYHVPTQSNHDVTELLCSSYSAGGRVRGAAVQRALSLVTNNVIVLCSVPYNCYC